MRKRKSFTLVEILVTLLVIIVVGAAGSMAYKAQQDRVNIDSDLELFRSAILKTQNLALTRSSQTYKYYVLVVNKSGAPANFNVGNPSTPATCIDLYCFTVKKSTMSIFALNDINSEVAVRDSEQKFPEQTTLASSSPINTNYQNSFFIIYFRANDGAPGFERIFYDSTDQTAWNSLWGSPPDYADLTLSSAGITKSIEINKVTGVMVFN